ncbi:MAG TPA: alpha/beta hydrolase-fold protein, partial [Terracidiphilus sp.]|nr:alpha/beta hydrolase-fold protein [Terracidiphilus sp.]
MGKRWHGVAYCMLIFLAIEGSLLTAPAEEPTKALASGSMEFLTLHSKVFSNTRTIRVWLPPGYGSPSSSHNKYPVFYFTDGVAIFHGRELDRTAADLVSTHQIPPVIFVGIDNGGSTRES